MPIYRSSPKNQENRTEFEQPVSATPMAVSLMVDSMVNMVQINRSKLDERKPILDSRAMTIEQFIAQSEGSWKSMRSGHSLAFQQFEECSGDNNQKN